MCVCRRANKDKNRSLLHIFAYMFDVWYSLYKRNTFFQPPHTKIGCFLPLPYKKYLWFSIIFMFEGEGEKENVPHRFWIGCSSLFVCLWATEKTSCDAHVKLTCSLEMSTRWMYIRVGSVIFLFLHKSHTQTHKTKQTETIANITRWFVQNESTRHLVSFCFWLPFTVIFFSLSLIFEVSFANKS